MPLSLFSLSVSRFVFSSGSFSAHHYPLPSHREPSPCPVFTTFSLYRSMQRSSPPSLHLSFVFRCGVRNSGQITNISWLCARFFWWLVLVYTCRMSKPNLHHSNVHHLYVCGLSLQDITPLSSKFPKDKFWIWVFCLWSLPPWQRLTPPSFQLKKKMGKRVKFLVQVTIKSEPTCISSEKPWFLHQAVNTLISYL